MSHINTGREPFSSFGCVYVAEEIQFHSAPGMWNSFYMDKLGEQFNFFLKHLLSFFLTALIQSLTYNIIFSGYGFIAKTFQADDERKLIKLENCTLRG